ncbi:MAG: HepT-like ribonuclease domain-containing protein [Candidatus Heimdallarchaeota archaeon]
MSKTEQDLLIEANGLRNRIIHGYNGLNDNLAFTALKRLLPGLKNILGKVKQWINIFFEG